MRAFSLSRDAAGTSWRSAGLLLLLAAAGLLGNWFKLELFFDCDFLFGSVFVMFALLRCGLAAGVAVGLVVSGCTYLHWHHPWAMVIWTAEALLVGWLHRRRDWELLTADIVFWFSVGALLVFVFYHQVMGFPVQSTLVVALKQGINGVLNTLIATALDLLLVGRRDGRRPLPSLRQLLFVAMSTMVVTPAFVYLYFDLQALLRQELAGLRNATSRTLDVCVDFTSLWIGQNQRKIEMLAGLSAEPGVSAGRMAAILDKTRASNPEFGRLGVVDSRGVTASFSPAVMEDGSSAVGVSLADRGYIHKVRDGRPPVVAELVIGRIGKPAPRVVLVVPVYSGAALSGAALGVLDPDRLRQLLLRAAAGEPTAVTLLDERRRVVASSREALKPMQPFALPAGGRMLPVGDGVFHWVPDAAKGVSAMKRWTGSFYLKEAAISSETGWSMVVESSLKPMLDELNAKMVSALGTVALLLLVIIGLSRWLAGRLSEVFYKLQAATDELPGRIVSGALIGWPAPLTREAEGLMANFRLMACTLQQHVLELNALNQDLEKRVELRTLELTEANRRLKREVDERQAAQSDLAGQQEQLEELNSLLGERVASAVAEVRQKDQVMIAQSRHAAMGEMIGNIAHQWRQPLNALGLLLANIKDAYHFQELDAGYLEQAVDEGNRLVQKMSVTITDFRNFFHPGKEAVSFSARRQIQEAIALVESSFVNDNISIRLWAERDVELFGFPNEYSQVLLNLLSNARDAMSSTGVKVGSVEIVLSERNGVGCVTVADNGGGVAPGNLDRIFEPYFSTKELGTGIGLYMSKMIIERNMHGSVQVRNLEQGAEFTICTPLAKAAALS